MALIDLNGDKINPLEVCRISAVKTLDTGTPDRTNNNYTKTYFYDIVLSGEVAKRKSFDTSALATADRNSFVADVTAELAAAAPGSETGIIGGVDTYADLLVSPPADPSFVDSETGAGNGWLNGTYIVRNDNNSDHPTGDIAGTDKPDNPLSSWQDTAQLYRTNDNGTSWSWIVGWAYEDDDIVLSDTASYTGILSGASGTVRTALGIIDTDVATNTTHRGLKNNPHDVTADQVPTDETGVSVQDKLDTIDVIDSNEVNIPKIGTPTYDNLEDFVNTNFSAGLISGGTITDAGGATIDVAAGTGQIRATDSKVAQILTFNWSGTSGTAIPADTIRYIGVEYNAGSPQIIVKTSDSWDDDTEFPLGSVVNEGGTLHIMNNPQDINNISREVLHRLYETEPLQRADRLGGLIIGETGTRNLTVSAGELYDRLNEFNISAIDTSNTGETFDAYYSDGGAGFTKVADQTQWDNDQYDGSGGSLISLTNNRWGTHWVYIESDGGLILLYGTSNNSSQAGAESEVQPTSVPNRILAHGRLIGRLVFQKGAATATAIESAFSTEFAAGAVTIHNNLSTLQGGTTNEYYHLTSSQESTLTNGGNADSLHIHDADNITTDTTGESVQEKLDALSFDSLPPIIINGNGFEITTGIKGDIVVPFDCTLTGYDILADQPGTIQIDLWKDTYANYPATDADSITASAPVEISATGTEKNQDNTLTGWTTSLTKGDIIRINVDSATTIERVVLNLKVVKGISG